MNKMKSCLFTLIALAGFTIAKGQTVDEIIAKHVDAVGGKDKLAQVNSVYIESTTDVMGNQSSTKTYILNGKGYRNESDFNGQNMVQVVTDTGGWMINPFMGSSDPVKLPEEQFKTSVDQVYAVDPLFDYAAKGGKAELLGQEKVGDVNAYKIKYTNKLGGETTYYIDPSTWYVIQAIKQSEAMGQQVTLTITPSDYKKTDFGVAFPSKTHMDMGQFALDVNVAKVEINKTIDPAIFDMPK